MIVEKISYKFYNRCYWLLSYLVQKIYYGQAILFCHIILMATEITTLW